MVNKQDELLGKVYTILSLIDCNQVCRPEYRNCVECGNLEKPYEEITSIINQELVEEIKKWGNEICYEHHISTLANKRWNCPKCWKARG